MDMHSGGGNKIGSYDYIYIEAPAAEAVRYFEKRFGRDPHNVTCRCCGEDFIVNEHHSLEEATEFNRLRYKESVADYYKRKDVLAITAREMGKQ
jgi:hypothetical protein